MIHKSLLVLLVVVAVVGIAFAQGKNLPGVGTWYGEYVISSANDPLASRYDFWKELIRRWPDGRQEIEWRFYKNEKHVSTIVQKGRWGIDGSTYWSLCESYTQDGIPHKCSNRSAYKIESITDNEMRYTSLESGRKYRYTRVDDNFKLP
jgi:hypothetical protein